MNYELRLLLICVLSIVPLSLTAQSNDETLTLLEFNFANPGARALAMGGAFLGMADDATAALSNPAGLTILTRPELSAEFSSTSFQNQVEWFTGEATVRPDRDIGALTNLTLNLQSEDFPTNVQNLSYASFVYPKRLLERKMVLSGFYNEETKFERDYQTDGYSVCGTSLPADLCFPTFNQLPLRFPAIINSSLDLSIRSAGIAGAFQIHERLSIGGTISYSRFKIDSQTRNFRTFTNIGNPESVLTLTSNDGSLSYSVGGHLKVFQQLSLGLVLNRRPEYHAVSTFLPSDRTLGLQTTDQKFKVPNSFGIGLSYKPFGTLSLNMDMIRISYSDLMDGYYNAFFHAKRPCIIICNPYNTPDAEKQSLEILDQTELRFGGEYVIFLGKYPFSIRAGYWKEPFHGIVRKVDDAELQLFQDFRNDTLGDPFHSRSFIRENRHFSFGTGIVRDEFSVDWAYDYSKDNKRFVISTTYYFL